MMINRALFFSVACTILFPFASWTQATFELNASNVSWNSASSWTITSGSDADGIPDANDNVVIDPGASGRFVTLSSSGMACNSLQISSDANGDAYLVISGGGDLTVSDLTITATSVNSAYINFQEGTLDINGNLSLDGNGTASLARIDAGGSGQKNLHIAKSLTSSDGQIQFSGDNFETYFDGMLDQTIPVAGSDFLYDEIIVSNTSGEVSLGGDLNDTRLDESITVKINATLNMNGHSLDDITESAGKISIEAFGTLKLEDQNNFPDQLTGTFTEVTSLTASSTIEYYVSDGQADTVFKQAFAYPLVVLSGTGIKRMVNDISSGGSREVGSIDLQAGTLEIDGASKTFELGTSAYTGEDQTVSVQSGAILSIENDFTSYSGTYFSFNRNSTVEYASSGNQTVYAFDSNGSGDEAVYGNLLFSDSNTGNSDAKRNVTASITVHNVISFSDSLNLILKDGAYLTLKSDATGDASLGPMDTENGFLSYEGTSGIVAQKRIVMNADSAYRDFSTPVQSTTLEDWEQAGMILIGIPGSNYPDLHKLGEPVITAYYYDETELGDKNVGWNDPASTAREVHSFMNSNLNSCGLRIFEGYVGRPALTLVDTGEVFQGDVRFQVTFSSTGRFDVNNATGNGWNFVGNPFPSSISWDSVYTHNVNPNQTDSIQADSTKKGISPVLYIWMPSDKSGFSSSYHSGENYVWYNPATGYGATELSTIPAFQGFWVKVVEDGNSVDHFFTVKERHKLSEEKDFYKSKGKRLTKNHRAQLLTEILLLREGEGIDGLASHHWPGATLNFDLITDVSRFGALTDTTASLFAESRREGIDFMHNGTAMGVKVNAFSHDNDHVRLPIFLSSPEGGNYTLKLEKVHNWTRKYQCARITNVLTGVSFDLNTTDAIELDIPASFAGKAAIITLVRDLKTHEITTFPATCVDTQDGFLRLDLSKHTGHRGYDLYYNGAWFDAIAPGTTVYKKSVAAGKYNLIPRMDTNICAVSNTIVVSSHPEITSAFQWPEGPESGTPVPFTNTSENASTFEWTFSDNMATTAEKHPEHLFKTPGTHWVSLTAKDSSGLCTDHLVKYIQIADGTVGIESIKAYSPELEKRGDLWFLTIDDNTGVLVEIVGISGRIIRNFRLSGEGPYALDGVAAPDIVRLTFPSGDVKVIRVPRF